MRDLVVKKKIKKSLAKIDVTLINALEIFGFIPHRGLR